MRLDIIGAQLVKFRADADDFMTKSMRIQADYVALVAVLVVSAPIHVEAIVIVLNF